MTFTVQMPSKKRKNRFEYSRRIGKKFLSHRPAFTLAEITVVVFIVSLFVSMAMLNVTGWLTETNFKSQARDLMFAFQKASTTASETQRRYEVIIDLAEQKYILRQITSSDLDEILPDDIIIETDLGKNCRVVYVRFADGTYTDESWAKFRVGRFGWQAGGAIGLLDGDDNEYTLIINRLNPIVKLQKGAAEMLESKFEDELPF